jgi:hypothetical protein
MMFKMQQELSSEEIFDYLKMFNYLAVSDEELSARLPEIEFELSFNREGDIYVNGEPMGVNVKQRYEALALR